MLCLVIMLGGVLVLRVVAATDMPASQAQAQVHLGVLDCETLLAAARTGYNRSDLIQMNAYAGHGYLLAYEMMTTRQLEARYSCTNCTAIASSPAAVRRHAWWSHSARRPQQKCQEGWSPAEMAGDTAATTPRSAVRSLQTRCHRPQSRPVTEWCGRRADKDEGGKAFDSVGVAGLTEGQLDRSERLFRDAAGYTFLPYRRASCRDPRDEAQRSLRFAWPGPAPILTFPVRAQE
jgi:hypothetical protein